MYSLGDFGKMIADRARLDAHAEALRRVVRPGSVVLDIGAGTGIISLLACQAGARRVYAVEPLGAVQILADAARDNGFADRIVVLQRRSSDVSLPERADVIVSDLRGVLPPFGTHFADVIDARTRLLAPGGHLLPTSDTMWVAVASAGEAFEERRGVWQSRPYGLDLRSAQRFADNSMQKLSARPDQPLTEPVQWASLHYPTLSELALRGAGTCVVAKRGAAHGFVVWFDTVLVDGVGYSNAPGEREGIYGQMFFGWPEEVAVEAGDRISFDLRADPLRSGYLWTWATEVRRAGGGEGVRRFRQSTFESFPMSADELRKRASTFVPTLLPSGEEALEVLGGMRAGRTVGEIAAALLAAHPERFRSLDHARGRVAELVERFGA